jgi:hypothetical protein
MTGPRVIPGSGVPEVEQEGRFVDPAVSREREWQMTHTPDAPQLADDLAVLRGLVKAYIDDWPQQSKALDALVRIESAIRGAS